MNSSASRVFQTVTGIVPFPSTYLLVSDHEGGNDADIFANLKEANITLRNTQSWKCLTDKSFYQGLVTNLLIIVGNQS